MIFAPSFSNRATASRTTASASVSSPGQKWLVGTPSVMPRTPSFTVSRKSGAGPVPVVGSLGSGPAMACRMQGGVLHRAREGTHVVETQAQRHGPGPAHPAVGGADAHQIAERGGQAHRAAGVGAECRGSHPRRHAGGRAAAAAARRVLEAPGVSRRAESAVRPGAAAREFLQVRLSDDDRPRGDESLHGFRRLARRGFPQNAAARRGGVAFQVEQVLERNGDPVERPPVFSTGEFCIQPPRLFPGEFEGGSREGVDGGVQPLGSGDVGLDHLARLRFACFRMRAASSVMGRCNSSSGFISALQKNFREFRAIIFQLPDAPKRKRAFIPKCDETTVASGRFPCEASPAWQAPSSKVKAHHLRR